eukprot:CAMPEP_0170560556 /NCGR_PEP_ID=MMETSP0211-20121228/49572_1 /TAXON_ID=311385 /ORGANISM="Pseudokeronopsis sp., Strain OXSARD2" /LENGTH=33 /DNA_ID= /DNA_START= /DNA_END= /DNA_ORIENTATION=
MSCSNALKKQKRKKKNLKFQQTLVKGKKREPKK